MKVFVSIILFFVGAQTFAAESFKTIGIDELENLMKSKKELSIYDVNVESTRTFVGVISGAQLIDSASQYDVKVQLPADKSRALVFYCANEMCTSSHIAANKAIAAGYKNVSVLKVGIYGWKKSGKTLVKIKHKSTGILAADVEPGEASELVEHKQAIIIDVRENEERHEIIPGELWFPTSRAKDQNAWSEFKQSLPKGKTLIFYCASGIRSKRMAEKLKDEGFNSLYFSNIDQWKSAGLRAVSGPAQ